MNDRCSVEDCPNIALPGYSICYSCRIWEESHPGTKRPKVFWIVSTGKEDPGEFGVEINGVPHMYYKWPDPSPSRGVRDVDYRIIAKREFGEVLRAPDTVFAGAFAKAMEGERKRIASILTTVILPRLGPKDREEVEALLKEMIGD